MESPEPYLIEITFRLVVYDYPPDPSWNLEERYCVDNHFEIMQAIYDKTPDGCCCWCPRSAVAYIGPATPEDIERYGVQNTEDDTDAQG